mgnify:FL=1
MRGEGGGLGGGGAGGGYLRPSRGGEWVVGPLSDLTQLASNLDALTQRAAPGADQRRDLAAERTAAQLGARARDLGALLGRRRRGRRHGLERVTHGR